MLLFKKESRREGRKKKEKGFMYKKGIISNGKKCKALSVLC